MPRIASAALVVVAGGAVLLLQGCGASPEVTIMATQTCDDKCEVQIACVADKCRRIPGKDCLETTEGECFHHETCEQFRDETAKKRECDMMTACCSYNSVLMGPDKMIDPVCSIASDPICSTAHPEPELLATQLCDNQCEVSIICDENNMCKRRPSAGCLNAEIEPEGPCYHHETCQEFRDESATQRECDMMTACCRYNSILIGPDKVKDPICTLATDSICSSAHPEPELLATQLCDNQCEVSIICDENNMCKRRPSAGCLNAEIEPEGPCYHHETCQEFRDENATQRECDMMTACCRYNSILIGADKVKDPICALASDPICSSAHPEPELLATQLCDNECEVSIICDEDNMCKRRPSAGCLNAEIEPEGPCFHHETCQEFRDESATRRECDMMTACCRFNSILIGENKTEDPICTLASDEVCGGHPDAAMAVTVV